MHHLRRLLLLLATSLPAAAQVGGGGASEPLAADPGASEPSAAPLLQRVVFLGASASAGYGLSLELKAEVMLGDVFDCMVEGRRPASIDLADVRMFHDPLRLGEEMVERARAQDPTLVVAVDYLFWFSYHSMWRKHSDRFAALETGLALLGRLEAPILLGDIPDVTPATHGRGPFGGPLVVKAMIPEPEELERMNQRVRQWAAARGDVVVLPMGEFLGRIAEGQALDLRGNRWPPDSLNRFLQKDLLHPRVEGAISLLILGADRLVREREDLSAEHFQWDAARIRQRLLEATAPSRERKLERERRRAERRRRLQERIRGGGDPPRGERDGGAGGNPDRDQEPVRRTS